jgi:glucose-1-phosphate adenylyltransferase
MHRILAVVLGGGRGERLYPLTQYRSKPAVPFGGKYRLVDISISNCLNSGIRKIYILTQFLSASLNRHLYQTYRLDGFTKGFVEILAAEQTLETAEWYQGTADAVRKQQHRFARGGADEVMVLAGDHLYRMDYSDFVQQHWETEAEVTVGVHVVDRSQAQGVGLVCVNEEGRIVDFVEKPHDDKVIDRFVCDVGDFGGNSGIAQPCLASMGIYLFERNVLRELLEECPDNDFGYGVVPYAIRTRKVYAYPFNGYWEDVGTIRTFYEANLRLTDPVPEFNLYLEDSPIFTRARFLPASKVEDCRISRSIVSEGCIISGAEIARSVIGLRTIVREGVRISNSVVLGADFYELDRPRESDVPVGFGRGVVVENAIVDKNARIGEGAVIRNEAGLKELDKENYSIREGIVVVPKNAVIPPGTVI